MSSSNRPPSPSSSSPSNLPTSSNQPPPPPPPPPSAPPSLPESRPDILTTLRRFSDHHISTLLHNLIGLPSIVSRPTPSQNWILDSDLPSDHPDHPRPRTRRSGSDSIVDEIRKLEEEEREKRNNSGGSGGGSGGVGGGGAMGGMGGEIQRTVSNTIMPTAGTGVGEERVGRRDVMDELWEEVFGQGRSQGRDQGPDQGQEMWSGATMMMRPFEMLMQQHNRMIAGWPHRSPMLEYMLREGCGDRGSDSLKPPADSTISPPPSGSFTELDYYDFFDSQTCRQMREAAGMLERNVTTPSDVDRDPAPNATQTPVVVGRFEEVSTVRGADGAVRTRRTRVKRFGDGTEERTVEEDTKFLTRPELRKALTEGDTVAGAFRRNE